MTVTHRAVAPATPATLSDLWTGRRRRAGEDPPRWFRPGYAALLVATAVLYLWDVGANGNANTFYAAAVQASTRNPVAWLFAAVDAPGFITVDKPPADNWWMGLWANLFGFSSWSMLVPQAVLGHRHGGAAGAHGPALVAGRARRSSPGAVLALTPVAVIMFRFDDPDPMLTFLLVAAAYALVRAVDAAPRRAGTWWLVACGLLIGLGFLAKMGVALLVVPAFALVYLVASAVPWRRRIGQLLGGLARHRRRAGLVPGAGRPVAGVVAALDRRLDRQLAAPARRRLQRALAHRSAAPAAGPGEAARCAVSGPAPGGFAGFGGQAGLGRMFSSEFGGQIAWLLPAALLALVALLWVTRRAPATDRLRAAALLWGGWLVVSAAVFSFMEGTVHSYYTIVMAPPIAALVAIGAREAWRAPRRAAAPGSRPPSGSLGTALWSAVLLGRSPTFLPWLPGTVLAAGVLAAVLVVVPTVLARRAGVVATLVLGLVATLGGASAYAIDTVVTPHAGTEAMPPAVRDRGAATARAAGTTGPAGRRGPAGRPGPARPPAAGGAAAPGRLRVGRGRPAGRRAAARRGTQWSAATPTTMAAAGLELASDTSVMGLGGFSGSDPTPTLPQFQADVAAGRSLLPRDRRAPAWVRRVRRVRRFPRPAPPRRSRSGSGRTSAPAPSEARPSTTSLLRPPDPMTTGSAR